jgi:hypothetical protein
MCSNSLPKCSTAKKDYYSWHKRARDLSHLNAAGDRNILLKKTTIQMQYIVKNVYY